MTVGGVSVEEDDRNMSRGQLTRLDLGGKISVITVQEETFQLLFCDLATVLDGSQSLSWRDQDRK
jgi:hypothetical protein